MNTILNIDTSRTEASIYNLIDVVDKELLSAPKGYIRLESSKGYPRYYYYKNRSETCGKYLSADNIGFITSICQRDYYIKLLKKLKELINHYQRGIHFDIYVEIDSVYYSFNPGKRSLIKPIIPDIESFVEEWHLQHPGSLNTFPIENGIYTNNGELVRSKSEKIIADRLLDYGIPYAYEPSLIIDGLIKYPDFLVLNKVTRETLIWEHLGLADSVDYNSNNLSKLALYEANGYLVGKNVITSFESVNYPLSTKLIDNKINDFLLD
ncbi:MAG: hypothetical protein E7274_06105 [Pseudobutyrivibrio ruminis]|uniref:hypothetical protein n=1 Tax=Pseudobutyrivibrio ruminis TaxID=46206 RepID=UPI0026E95372|nr:hypothetical protein [Pseudobutyrivibrio ruminis]MBE5913616.1 hypothetical protein [Pseudobutyrivibrio ruminis]